MDNKFGVLLDIDGCLTSSDGNVCLDYYEANAGIARLARCGHVGDGPSIRLCSGRDRNSVELMANFFGMVNSWMIVEGGAALFNPTTREVKMNPAITPDMEKFFKWVANKKVPAILARHRYLQRYLGYMVCQSLEKKAGSSVELEPAINDIIQRQWRRHGWSLYKWIKRRRLKVERYFNRAINIIPAGVSKGTAVKFLMGIEGWDPSWCIAVGDSESDFPLFRSVGRIGCPSNATPGCIKFVREHRGKVSIHPYTRGVLDVIDWWLGNESMG